MNSLMVEIIKRYGQIVGLEYTKKHFFHVLNELELKDIDKMINNHKDRYNFMIDIYNADATNKINTKV